MAATPCLQFLRPCAIRPLTGRQQPIYLRFYELARQYDAAQRRCHLQSRRGFTTGTAKSSPGTTNGTVEDAAAERSLAVDLRIKELTEAGALKYPRIEHDVKSYTIHEFNKKYASVTTDEPSDEVQLVYGRLLSIRRAGSKLVFLDMVQGFERVQGMANLGSIKDTGVDGPAFKRMSRLLKRGDLIGIKGKAVRTPTGQLTVDATELPRLLSPGLVPLPEKLVDEDTRVQHRHIDFLVNREAVDTLRLRSYLIRYIRQFLESRNFLEFSTPILAENAGGATARPFSTVGKDFASKELALRIAPELWLKRLVVGGVDRVFEIGPSFRNEGTDTTHNPEFTTCEFYSAYWNLEDLLTATEDMIKGLVMQFQDWQSTDLSSLAAFDPAPYNTQFRRVEFIPAIEAALGAPLPDLESETAAADIIALLHKLPSDITIDTHDSPTLPKLLDRLAAALIEPLSATAPLFITHHPACMSPLAKSFPSHSGSGRPQVISARAELFVGGREVANMYEEENDPFAQRRKFVEQVRLREGASGTEIDEDGKAYVDESYVAALESGLPPTGGFGCGIERLVMLLSGAKRIGDTLSFGTLRNVVALSSAGRK